MRKCYGLIRVYDEYAIEVGEKGNLVLPENVTVHSSYHNYLKLATDIIVVSDEPVNGVTDYVAPGSEPKMVDYVIEDGKVVVRA